MGFNDLTAAAPYQVTDKQATDAKHGQSTMRPSHPGLLASMIQAAARE